MMKLTKNEKIGLAVAAGVVLVGTGTAIHLHNKAKAATPTAGGATTGVPTGTAPSTIEATYASAPGVAIDLTKLPMVHAAVGNGPGSTYWVLGDETAGPAVASKNFLTTAQYPGISSVMPTSSMGGVGTSNFLQALSAQLATDGTQGIPGGAGGTYDTTGTWVPDGTTIPTADIWIAFLGPSETASDPSLPIDQQLVAAETDIQNIRKVVPGQRILWVLARSTDPALAKALTLSHEEWIRSSGDDGAQMGQDANNALGAPDVATLNKLFAAPTAS